MPSTPKPKLAHLGIMVTDVERMIDFYSNVMGLAVTDRGKAGPDRHDIVFMSANAAEHHEFVLVSGRPENVNFNVVQQMSFLVDSLDELRVLRDRVLADGCEIERSITHGNAWSIYFFDPEGNRAEVYCHTPWHIPQPHAFPIDFSLPNEEIERVTEAHCRETQGFMTASEREAMMERVIVQDE